MELPQEHLTELREKTKVVRKHQDYVGEVRLEFCGMTKEQLVERLVLAYDELVKVSTLKREVELELKDEIEQSDRFLTELEKICGRRAPAKSRWKYSNAPGQRSYVFHSFQE